MKITDLIPLLSQQRTMPTLLAENPATTLDDIAIYQKAGHRTLEILMRTPQAAETIQAARKKFPDMIIGAGTVLTPAQVDEAFKAGAQFIVAPAMDVVVSEAVKRHGLPFIPGVFTATDVAVALREGWLLQKLYPQGIEILDVFGGPGGPFAHTPLRLIAAFGVSKENISSVLAHRLVGGIIAGWLYNLHGDALRRELTETLALARPRAA